MKATLEHLAVQLGTGFALAGATYLAGADYHALGTYAAVAQGAAAVLVSAIHALTGTGAAQA